MTLLNSKHILKYIAIKGDVNSMCSLFESFIIGTLQNIETYKNDPRGINAM